MLGKVMERISTDYEELKRVFESQKCPKDDKILALRKTARSVALKEQSHKILVLGMTARSDTLKEQLYKILVLGMTAWPDTLRDSHTRYSP